VGVYYAIVDHKHKRFLWLGKVYAFHRFFRDEAPFTLADHKTLCGESYAENEYDYPVWWFEAIVDYCTEADWDCEVMADDHEPSYHDLDDEYEKYQIDSHGNVIPDWLADRVDERCVKHDDCRESDEVAQACFRSTWTMTIRLRERKSDADS
jgi:hypothetical protein